MTEDERAAPPLERRVEIRKICEDLTASAAGIGVTMRRSTVSVGIYAIVVCVSGAILIGAVLVFHPAMFLASLWIIGGLFLATAGLFALIRAAVSRMRAPPGGEARAPEWRPCPGEQVVGRLALQAVEHLGPRGHEGGHQIPEARSEDSATIRELDLRDLALHGISPQEWASHAAAVLVHELRGVGEPVRLAMPDAQAADVAREIGEISAAAELEAGGDRVQVVRAPYRAGWSCLDVVIIDSAPQ